MTRRTVPLALLASLVFVALLAAQQEEPPPAEGEEGRIGGTIEGTGFTKIPIALPDPQSVAGARDLSRELIETVRADLEFSGFFDVIDPALYRIVRGTAMTAWREIGADALAQTTLGLQGSQRLDLVARVYDTPSGSTLLGHRYGGSRELVRRMAHQLSDDIVKQLTGQQGIALSRIAFVSGHKDAKELYLMDYDGHRIRRVTTNGALNLTPAFSPDGSRIAWASWRSGRPAIYVMEERSGRIVPLRTVQTELASSPDWSPDGRRIAYTAHVDGNSEIYVVDIASGRSTRLTRTPSIETSPAFSPNGREIAFTSDRSGTPQIYVMDAEGLNVRRLSQGGYSDSPAWSPRGDRLAYQNRAGGRFDIVVQEVSTGRLARLGGGRGSSENPRWSPDGRHIVFSSSRGGGYDIYTMTADGSDVRRRTKGGNCYMPDWR